MADSLAVPGRIRIDASAPSVRHPTVVRLTHWLTTLSFFALLVTGVEILISHPRFYWGETGNVTMKPLFALPIPASRSSVPTGYGYVMPDQNGWSRYLHFEAAWILVGTGIIYVLFGLLTGRFGRNFVRSGGKLSYNLPQRLTYILVVFALFPLTIWTGLAMSPGIAAACPLAVTLLGGQQSARTMHFFLTVLLVAFLAIHVLKISVSGFRSRMRAMIPGAPEDPVEER